MEIEDVPLFDKREYQRQYNKSAEGKASRKKYRHDNSKHVTDAKYLSRKFVAIDGEGINVTRGLDKGKHLYVMLAISNKPSLIDPTGLKTDAILHYLFENLSAHDINVIYGGSYDFNLWLRDLLSDEVRAIYNSNYESYPVWRNGYGIRWIKGKSFEITDGEKTVTINDVISFFQRPFIQACDEYLGEYEGRAQLVREKARRGNFRIEEIDSIDDYNQLELRLLVQLMNELRARLNKVGLRPRRWNSPGAIASALFLREKVKEHRNENLPAAVTEASRYAYAGGRFELIKYGSVNAPVYEYDINSAYPRALLDVPSLAGAKWKHWKNPNRKQYAPFSLYKVSYTGTNPTIPGPLFMRSENGTISYPLKVTTWVWAPEYETLRLYCEKIPGAKYDLLEVWECSPASEHKPFGFIDTLYKKRQLLKAAGDGAHVGIKLALNSLYGKLAQQVGWREADEYRPLRVPTYHQLEWAGYTTSYCRANVLRAVIPKIDSVIAFETDAVFTTEPLNINIGTGLGEWEETRFSSFTYVQSGHYYATTEDGKEIVKCRGIDKGFVSRKEVEAKLANVETQRILKAELTRFYGAGIALARGLVEYWCRWITEPKMLMLMPTGKRLHGACNCTGPELELNRWHYTYCPIAGGASSEYPVEWINPNPNMNELSELRESENTFDN